MALSRMPKEWHSDGIYHAVTDPAVSFLLSLSLCLQIGYCYLLGDNEKCASTRLVVKVNGERGSLYIRLYSRCKR